MPFGSSLAMFWELGKIGAEFLTKHFARSFTKAKLPLAESLGKSLIAIYIYFKICETSSRVAAQEIFRYARRTG
jgi:hypothetical protein